MVVIQFWRGHNQPKFIDSNPKITDPAKQVLNLLVLQSGTFSSTKLAFV